MAGLNYEIIRDAIRGKKSVSFQYEGFYREACPHCIGSLKQKSRVLFYQFGGETSSGKIMEHTEKNWRVMLVEKIENLQVISAAWHTHDSYCGPGKHFDLVDAAVPWQ